MRSLRDRRGQVAERLDNPIHRLDPRVKLPATLAFILLTSTTPLPHLLLAMEKLKVPQALVMTTSFMYRYIFILEEEVMRMRQARDSRNFGGRRLWQIKVVGHMVGTLFIRAYERGERVYAAMLSRGFDGQVRALHCLALRRADAHLLP